MIRRWLGVDGVDVVIQAGVTLSVAVLLASVARQNEEMVVSATFAASFLVLAFRRHWARKRGDLGTGMSSSGEYHHELEQRVADLEATQQRVYELEERLDFAERMLARRESPERIGGNQ